MLRRIVLQHIWQQVEPSWRSLRLGLRLRCVLSLGCVLGGDVVLETEATSWFREELRIRRGLKRGPLPATQILDRHCAGIPTGTYSGVLMPSPPPLRYCPPPWEKGLTGPASSPHLVSVAMTTHMPTHWLRCLLFSLAVSPSPSLSVSVSLFFTPQKLVLPTWHPSLKHREWKQTLPLCNVL